MRETIQMLLLFVEGFFILYMIGYASFLFLSVAVGSSDLYAGKRRVLLRNELSNDYYVPVSILVPAHNEGVTIQATIRSLLALDYKLYEIIVVDDGSSDNTVQILRDAFRLQLIDRPIQRRVACRPAQAVYESRAWKVPITLITKENGGKADALNMGINVAAYPYFVCIDADSVLQCDSLEKIVRPLLENAQVVAVGGAVRPCNGAEIETGRIIRYSMPKKLLACMQVLEYDRSASCLTNSTGILSSPAPSACSKRSWSSRPAAMIPPPWGRIWSWLLSSMCSAGNTAYPTSFGTPPTPSAGRRCRNTCGTCAASGGAGISGFFKP